MDVEEAGWQTRNYLDHRTGRVHKEMFRPFPAGGTDNAETSGLESASGSEDARKAGGAEVVVIRAKLAKD